MKKEAPRMTSPEYSEITRPRTITNRKSFVTNSSNKFHLTLDLNNKYNYFKNFSHSNSTTASNHFPQSRFLKTYEY